MRKAWLSIFALIVACALSITIYFWTAPKDEPELKIEFDKAPPWIIRPGQNLTLNITIKNDGKAPAKNVVLNFTVSTGFKISESETNQYNENFPEIKTGEAKILILTITPATAIQPGNYPFILIVYAENASPLTFSDKITVQLPT